MTFPVGENRNTRRKPTTTFGMQSDDGLFSHESVARIRPTISAEVKDGYFLTTAPTKHQKLRSKQ